MGSTLRIANSACCSHNERMVLHRPGCLQVSDLQSDALFILLVEKDAAFMRLAEDRFYNTYPCIILTAKGQPDVASRYMLPHSLVSQMLLFRLTLRCNIFPKTAERVLPTEQGSQKGRVNSCTL